MKFRGGLKLFKAKRVVMFVAALFSVMARVALAQSCAMCYQSAAASGARGKVALQHGILILALPAISIFSALLFLLYSRRNVNESVLQARELDQDRLRDENRQLPQAKATFVAAE
jgi:hypothetical protein